MKRTHFFHHVLKVSVVNVPVLFLSTLLPFSFFDVLKVDNYDLTFVGANLIITNNSQTINVTVSALANAVYNTTFNVSATATSGLSVAITTTGDCSGSGSAAITMTSGAGTCVVHYNQPGDPNFSPAPEVTESVAAQKADQTITVTTSAPAALTGTSFNVAANASSGLAVTYSAAGSCSNTGASFTLGVSGTCAVQYDQAGDANYNAAPQVTETTNILLFNNPPVITEGTSISVNMSEDGAPAAFALTLNATDPDGNTLTWSILTNAAHGVATANGVGTSRPIGYVQNPNYSGNDSFVVQVSDGVVTDTITVNVLIAAVNDAPVNTVPSVQHIQESSPLNFSPANTNAISTDDVDAGNGLLSVTLNITNGTLTLGSTTGLSSLNGNKTANVSFNGTLANINNALKGLVFNPTPGFNGPALLTTTTND